MANFAAALILVIAGFPFFYKRALRFLRYYQQEEYFSVRFLRWIIAHRAADRISLVTLFGCVLGAVLFAIPLLWSTLAGIIFIIRSFWEEDPRKTGKLTLKMTQRATQIFYLSLIFYGCIGILLLCFPSWIWVGLLILFQAVPLLLMLSNTILWPFEKRKQVRFMAEAKQILAKVSPFVIGITGSYGKTSSKDALAKILQVTLGPTFWPPKSVNSPMGITREIRERLVEGYEYAIIEMGAYGIGSIKRLCELTPPQAGLITAIGNAHLDRFGSQENIYLAKSELAQAIGQDGILVCNGDDEGARKIAMENPKKQTYLYGFNAEAGHLDCWVSAWHISLEGTHFTLHWQGNKYESSTPLLGRTALSNLLGVFTIACALGADPEFVLAVIRSLEPVENRLQVKKEDGIFYVHDAYNSNPNGFRAAVEVLAAIPAQRRIVMTPGMIELGDLQHKENYKIAKIAGGHCDIALVVGQTNQAALVEGFKEAGMPDQNIHRCSTRQQAFEQLAALQRMGDVILIENDLTDLYETKVKF